MVLRNVLDLLVPLLWILLAAAVFYSFWSDSKRYGWLAALKRLFSWRLVWPLTSIVAVSVLSASLVFIDPREVGVVVSLFSDRGIRPKPLTSGLTWIVPLAENVVRYPIVMQTYTMAGRPLEGEQLGDDAIRVRTADGQLVIIDVSMIFRIRQERVIDLHIEWQHRYVRDLLRPFLRAMVRSEASKYTVDEINSQKRKVFEASLNDLIKNRSAKSGIETQGVLVRNISFSSGYAAAVEEKMTALQRVTETEYKAKQIANLANGSAERIRIKARAKADAKVVHAEAGARARLIEARAEADALTRIGTAIEDRSNLLTFKYIEKLSPRIKAMLLPESAPLILPMPNVADNNTEAVNDAGPEDENNAHNDEPTLVGSNTAANPSDVR